MSIKPNSPSISNLVATNKESATEQVVSTINLPQEENKFTQEQLEVYWTNYANELKSKGKFNLAIILTSKKPILTDNFIIDFTINNVSAIESLNEEKMNFLGYLRKELKNFKLQLNIILSETEDKTSLYTASDRFKYLAEKNPSINKLRQTFDLDIDF